MSYQGTGSAPCYPTVSVPIKDVLPKTQTAVSIKPFCLAEVPYLGHPPKTLTHLCIQALTCDKEKEGC